MEKPRIIVISAPSGGGKTTLIRALLEQQPNLDSVVTHTTRPMREGEINNLHYYFVDTPTFEKMIQHNAFVEWAKVYDYYYGTSRAAVEKICATGKTPIINLDWQGAQSIRNIYGDQVFSIFIIPPSLDELKKRLQERGDNLQSIEKRLHAAQDEINHASEYNEVIVNDNFDLALQHLQELITY